VWYRTWRTAVTVRGDSGLEVWLVNKIKLDRWGLRTADKHTTEQHGVVQKGGIIGTADNHTTKQHDVVQKKGESFQLLTVTLLSYRAWYRKREIIRTADIHTTKKDGVVQKKRGIIRTADSHTTKLQGVVQKKGNHSNCWQSHY
jgi:hypothetical protein